MILKWNINKETLNSLICLIWFITLMQEDLSHPGKQTMKHRKVIDKWFMRLAKRGNFATKWFFSKINSNVNLESNKKLKQKIMF